VGEGERAVAADACGIERLAVEVIGEGQVDEGHALVALRVGHKGSAGHEADPGGLSDNIIAVRPTDFGGDGSGAGAYG
jgi:hypothetical protein